ncbi:hypothetical protein [Paenibacillus sp. OSY-SE]|uniref:hypothetical protein n=1 Tax=Paenibacillus sp. OSY-SE TaxID=1196323 RepID=UPI0002D8D28C|nr:hypothetical protein [Paenibacillus sp. OSY-SE]
MQDMARFKAELGKKMTVGDKEVEIKLLVPLKAVQENFLFLSSKQGSEINVIFGDPQASMRFDEEEMLHPYRGRYFTADRSGVVTNIQRKDDDEDDENQGDLLEQNADGEETETDAGEEVEGEATPDETRGTPESGEGEQEDSTEESVDSDTPEWMRESDNGEINFESEESGTDEAGTSEEVSEQQETENAEEQGTEDAANTASAEVDKEALEQFILEQRPVFDEIPIDFPALLEKRLNLNKTWREIANEAGMTSGQLSSKWSAYKKRAAEKMKDGGAA